MACSASHSVDRITARTANHIVIPATHICIVPPKGFEMSTVEPGLIYDSILEINITELYTINFYQTIERFSSSAFGCFDKTNKDLLFFERLKINTDSIYYTEQLTEKAIFALLVGGDSTFSYRLSISIPVKDTAQHLKAIRASFYSVFIDRSVAPNYFIFTDFTLDRSLSNLDGFQFSVGHFWLTEAGRRPALGDSLRSSYLICAEHQSRDTVESTKDVIAQFIQSGYSSSAAATLHNQYNQRVLLPNCDAQEAYLWQIENGKKRLLYFMIITQEKRSYSFRANVCEADSTVLESFRKLAHSFRFK
jgi:hypothetical protein